MEIAVPKISDLSTKARGGDERGKTDGWRLTRICKLGIKGIGAVGVIRASAKVYAIRMLPEPETETTLLKKW